MPPEFRRKISAVFSVKAELSAELQTAFNFRLAADQIFIRGDNFENTRKAYVHQIRFFLDPKGWIAVRVSDEAGKVLTGVTLSVRRPDKSRLLKALTPGDLLPDGSYRVEKLPPGSYDISLPLIDQDFWKRGVAPRDPALRAPWSAPADVPASGHPVAAGDCVWSLAMLYGVPEEIIWKHPPNQALASKYKNRYTLLPGRTVQIPKRRIRTETRALNACHDFVVSKPAREMRVRLVDWGKPAAANISGKVKIAGQVDLDVLTDAQGVIRFPVPYGASEATIDIPSFGLGVYTVLLGYLAPIESGEGVRQRLENLGYYLETGGSDAAKRAALVSAVKNFQQTQGIRLADPQADGSVDRVTMDALVEKCGA